MKSVKTSNGRDFKCICGRYLFTLKDGKIYIKCRRCKKIHEIKLPVRER
jgi:phage FluMu protein Com